MPQKKKRQISETYPQFLEKERTKAEACHLFEDKVIFLFLVHVCSVPVCVCTVWCAVLVSYGGSVSQPS